MIGWILLAVAFFLFGAGCFIDALVHRNKTEQALKERDEAREQYDKLNTKNAEFFAQNDDLREALRAARDERATLKLQLVEATRPKPRRGGTKKTEAQ